MSIEIRFKLSNGQQRILKPLQKKMHEAYLKGTKGALMLQIEDNLKEAIGCFIPHEIWKKVNGILEPWLTKQLEVLDEKKS